MEPLPESQRAVDEFGPLVEEDLLQVMLDAAEQVRAVVPTLVGLSLGVAQEGLTFTVEATSGEIAALDAVQYLDGGPCADAVDGVDARAARAEAPTAGEDIDDTSARTFHHGDALAEDRWQWFALATAAAGVRSTLTLPVVVESQVVGSVNLYAAAVDAFDGHHEAVARICRAWAPGAVTNADLSFETRRAAMQTPQLLQERLVIGRAVEILVDRRGITVDEAEASIRDVAAQSGVSEYDVALLILESMGK